MWHEFIIINAEEIPETTTYLLIKGHEVCRVDNEIIVNNPLFLRGFKTFKVSFKNPGEGLDYHGNTIIPTSSLEQFISNIKMAQDNCTDVVISGQLNKLISLCKKAETQGSYIMHFGL